MIRITLEISCVEDLHVKLLIQDSFLRGEKVCLYWIKFFHLYIIV